MAETPHSFLAVALSFSGKVYFQRRQELKVLIAEPRPRELFQLFATHLERSPGRFKASICYDTRPQRFEIDWTATPNMGSARLSYDAVLARDCICFVVADSEIDTLTEQATLHSPL